MSNKLSEKYKNQDGREDNINRKELLEDYFEENQDKVLCVHSIDHYSDLPMKLLDIRGALDSLENEEKIECIQRESCAFSQHTPHKQYKFVPEEEREEKLEYEDTIKEEKEDIDTGMESILEDIKEKYDEGGSFLSSDFLDNYPDISRERVASALYRLKDEGILEKVGRKTDTRRGGVRNVYKLTEEEEEEAETEEEIDEKEGGTAVGREEDIFTKLYKKIKEIHEKEKNNKEIQKLDGLQDMGISGDGLERILNLWKNLKHRRLKKIMLLALHDEKVEEMTSEEEKLWESIREAIDEYGL